MKILRKKVLTLVLIVAIAASLAVSLAGCGSISITSVTIPAMLALVKGEASQLDIDYGADRDNVAEDALLEAAEKLELEWNSSNEEVAIVNENGMVTAYTGGTATITVCVKDTDIQSSCEVTVTVPLEKLDVEPEMLLYINGANPEDGYTDSQTLDVTLAPADADNVVLTFASSDESIATVDETGKVTAVANGKTTITVKSGEIQTEVEVTVYTAPSYIEVEDAELYVGRSGELKVTVDAENVTFTNPLTYKSSDEDVCKVDEDGVIAGISEGEATITVSNGTGVVGMATVTVVPAPAATSNRGNGNTSNGNSGGSTGSSGGDDAVETVGPAPAPAPQPEPTPAPAPEQPYCPLCKEYGHSGCYHGNGSDTGTCPVCGVGYSTWHEEILLNPETNPELYC